MSNKNKKSYSNINIKPLTKQLSRKSVFSILGQKKINKSVENKKWKIPAMKL